METLELTRSKEFIQVIEAIRRAGPFGVDRDRWIHPFKYRDEADRKDAMEFYGMDIFEIALSPGRWLYFQVRGRAYERVGGLGIDFSRYSIEEISFFPEENALQLSYEEMKALEEVLSKKIELVV